MISWLRANVVSDVVVYVNISHIRSSTEGTRLDNDRKKWPSFFPRYEVKGIKHNLHNSPNDQLEDLKWTFDETVLFLNTQHVLTDNLIQLIVLLPFLIFLKSNIKIYTK